MGYRIFEVKDGELGFNALQFINGLVNGLSDLVSTLNGLQSKLDGAGGSSLAGDNSFLLQLQAAMSQVQVATQSISQVLLIGGEIGKSIVSNIR